MRPASVVLKQVQHDESVELAPQNRRKSRLARDSAGIPQSPDLEDVEVEEVEGTSILTTVPACRRGITSTELLPVPENWHKGGAVGKCILAPGTSHWMSPATVLGI